MATVQNVQSVASEDATVHKNNGQGLPVCPGKRAAEYRLVKKAANCERCKRITGEENAEDSHPVMPELDGSHIAPDEVSNFTVWLDYKNADNSVSTIIVPNVAADDAEEALENAVGKMRVRVSQQRTWKFEPTEED